MTRRSRALHALRPVRLERGVVRNAEGSCLAAFGETRVLCAVTVEEGVPAWRKGSGEAWITAEYAMLPRSTRTRTPRERQQLGGRTQEIQRLIGRSVRAMVDDFRIGELMLKQGNLDAAAAAFEYAAGLAPDSPLIPYQQARIAIARKDEAAALSAVAAMTAKAPPALLRQMAADPAFAALPKDSKVRAALTQAGAPPPDPKP